MTTWGNADLLIEMLDRQLALLSSGRPERQVLALGRWLAFLHREPQLAELVAELMGETQRAVDGLTLDDGRIREELLALWREHEPLLRAHLADELGNEQLYAYGTMDGYASAVVEHPLVPVPLWPVFDEDPFETQDHVRALKHWTTWAIQRAESAALRADDALYQLQDRLAAPSLNVQRLKRQLHAIARVSAGSALCRLQQTFRDAVPRPPRRGENLDSAAADAHAWEVAFFQRQNEFADKLHSKRSIGLRALETDEVTAAAMTIRQDAATVTSELQLRILAGRSRLALVRRYAAQCEGFDAAILRRRLQTRKGKIESELTLDFARYVFQQGLTPVLDATVGGLRPDVLNHAPGALLYLEAKQYGEAHPRAKIKAAYRQVWSTWGRLTNVYDVREAFLLIFRVGGPRVELPPMLHHEGRVLYSLLADISPNAGSRERATPLAFAVDELVPTKRGSRT